MEEARLKIAAKVAKEEAKEKKKKDRAFRIMVNRDKRDQHAKGVAARKKERERKHQVANLQKAGMQVPEELLIPITDPTKAQPISAEVQAEIYQENEEEGRLHEERIRCMDSGDWQGVDSTSNWLHQDFVPLDDGDDEDNKELDTDDDIDIQLF